MKIKLLLFSLVLLAMGGSLFAQIQTPNVVRYDGYVAPAGGSQLASVAVCASGGSGGPPCSPLAVIYSDQYGTAQQSNPFAADNRGHYIFYAPAGTYAVQTYGTGYSTALGSITLVGTSAGGSSSPAPSIRFYFASTCTGTTGQCIQANGDMQTFNDCSWTNASTTITCNTPHFGAGQSLVNPVGMSVMGFQSCSADLTQAHATGGEIAPDVAMPTVTQLTDSQHIVISATPAHTQTLVTTAPMGGCLTVGHIDDTNFTNLWTAVNAASSCPKVTLGNGNFLVTKPPQVMWDNPAPCKLIGAQSNGLGNPGFGTTTLNAGFEVEGCGTGCSAVYLSTNFPNGDTCTHIPTSLAANALHTGACFVLQLMGRWHDFRIDGGGQNAATAIANKTLGPYMATGKLENFLCMNYGGYTGGTAVGIELIQQAKLFHVNNAGCGDTGIYIDNGGVANIGWDVVVESSSVSALFNGGTNVFAGQPAFVCYFCVLTYSQTIPFGNFGVVRNAGGTIRLIGGQANPGNGNDGGLNLLNGVQGYLCITAGCSLYSEHFAWSFSNGGGSNTNTALACTAACSNYILQSTLLSQSSGFDIQDVAGSKEFDLGGNTVTPRMSISGTVINSLSVASSPAVAGNFVPSANFGTGAAVTAVTGNATNFTFTLTNGSAAVGANPTIAVTFPTPSFWQTPSRCSLWQVGGTQAIVATTEFLAPSALSATGVTFTYNGTPTINLTEFYQGTCTN